MTPAMLCLTAASYIQARGHAKGDNVTSRGGLCTLGALRLAATGDATYAPFPFTAEGNAYTEAVNHLVDFHDQEGKLHWDPSYRLTRWNDQPRRTAREVVSVLKRCALELNGKRK